MKIAQIIYTGFGGLGAVAFSLVEADPSRDHDWLIGFAGDQPVDAGYATWCEQSGVRYGAFQTRPRLLAGWCGLFRWLRRERPDVVICHSIPTVLVCKYYSWRYRKKLLCVEHTANRVKSNKIKLISFLCMQVADRIVMLTPEYAEEIRQSYGCLYRLKKVRIVGNGIDTHKFRPGPDRIREAGTWRIGMAARFSFSKRQDMLVDLLERLRLARPALRFSLSLAGDGDELERVRRLAADTASPSDIEFLGNISEARVADWMRSLDIYVHATDAETLSTALLQAMSTGLPIVASDVPGVTSLLAGERGLCADNDPDAFARAVIVVVDGPEMARVRGENSRSMILSSYSSSIVLQRYLDIIRELV